MRRLLCAVLSALCLLSLCSCKKNEPDQGYVPPPVAAGSELDPGFTVAQEPAVRTYTVDIEDAVWKAIPSSTNSVVQEIVNAVVSDIPSGYNPSTDVLTIEDFHVSFPTQTYVGRWIDKQFKGYYRLAKAYEVAGYYVEYTFRFDTHKTAGTNPQEGDEPVSGADMSSVDPLWLQMIEAAVQDAVPEQYAGDANIFVADIASAVPTGWSPADHAFSVEVQSIEKAEEGQFDPDSWSRSYNDPYTTRSRLHIVDGYLVHWLLSFKDLAYQED